MELQNTPVPSQLPFIPHPDPKLETLVKIHPNVLKTFSLDGLTMYKRTDSKSPFIATTLPTNGHTNTTMSSFIQAYCVEDGEDIFVVTDEIKKQIEAELQAEQKQVQLMNQSVEGVEGVEGEKQSKYFWYIGGALVGLVLIGGIWYYYRKKPTLSDESQE